MIGSPTELIVIGGLVIVLFGAKRLPEMGRALGEGLREFRRSVSGVGEEAAPAETNPAAAKKEAGSGG